MVARIEKKKSKSESRLGGWTEVSLALGARHLWGKHNPLELGEGYACLHVFGGGGALDVSVGVNITCMIPAHHEMIV